MSRRWMWIAGAAAAAAIAVTVVLVATRGTARLDIPYVFLVYEVAPLDGQTEAQAVEQAIEGLRMRLDERGLDHATVLRDRQSPSRVRVELGGKDVPFDPIIALVERRAVLGIHRVIEGDPATAAMANAVAAEQPAGITTASDRWPGIDGRDREDSYVVGDDRARLEAWAVAKVGGTLGSDRRIVYEMLSADPATRTLRWRTYVVETAAIIGGADIAKASVGYDPSTLRPVVELELDSDGTARFAEATAAAVGGRLAIVLDGRVMSAPLVQSRITAGRVQVTMGGDDMDAQEREAHDLVAVLRTGAIPPLRLVERRDVGPSR